MINILLEGYDIDATWLYDELKEYIKPTHSVAVVAFSFRDSRVKSLTDWNSLYCKENGKFYEGITKGFKSYGISEDNIKFINYFADTKESAAQKIANADIVYFLGGLPDKMMNRIEEFDLYDALIKHDGIVMGYSAGAVIQLSEYHLSPDEDYPEFKYYAGVPYIHDFYVQVHYEDTTEQNKSIQRVLSEKSKTVYATALMSGAIVVNNGNIKLLGDVKTFTNSEEVKTEADIKGVKRNYSEKKIIKAKDVTIRQFNDSKCSLYCNEACPLENNLISEITEEDMHLPFSENGYYIPNNFCKGLAAKYMYSEKEKKRLFTGHGWSCTKYKCGHIDLGDCNHRMCVLAHLDRSIEVEYTEYDDICSECKKKKRDMMQKVYNQLAIDYNCNPDDFNKSGIIFTVAEKQEGRREMPFISPRLEIITMGKSIIINASKRIMPYVKSKFKNKSNHDILTSKLVYGANPYYLPDIVNIKPIQNDSFRFELVDVDIQSLYKNKGFGNALQYNVESKRPEVLAAVAYNEEEIVGIACASADSKTMWQIGVDVLPNYRGNGIAVKLVNMLTLETLNRGIVPYYTTDCANINSQKVAIKSGYIPAWTHCFKTRLPKFIKL